MSSALNNNLGREKIQQLLAAVGSEPTEDTTQIETVEYNWHQPHCFDTVQLKKLDGFTNEVATAVAEKFTALCGSGLNVAVTSTTEHFAAELIAQNLENEQNDYHLAFGPDQEHLCGLIVLPPQTAATLITQLLGGSESEKDSSEGLSQLEESLLLDIAFAIVEALSDSHSSYDFQPAEAIVKEQVPLEVRGAEELCKITFSIEKAGSENPDKIGEAHLLIPCDKLEPVAGKITQAAGAFSAQDISKAILEHLQQISISVTAQLATTVLTFEQIMNLQVNDILLLDKRVDEPIELTVEGHELFRGRPAKSTGKYAVVITEPFMNRE
jgi:flagellar motor switch protein FliM